MRSPLSILALGALLSGCGGESPPPVLPPTVDRPAAVADDDGGTPAAGPGTLFNACERIWCMTHRKNYFVDHFETGHVGWILHDDGHGDVFVPKGRTEGPAFPKAKPAALRLCGRHVHPWMLGRGGAVKRTGYQVALGYDRGHYGAYGTRLDPCCINGLGWGYLHAASPRQFRITDTATYREAPGVGWQRPFRG